jgi:hypothetical protein
MVAHDSVDASLFVGLSTLHTCLALPCCCLAGFALCLAVCWPLVWRLLIWQIAQYHPKFSVQPVSRT